MFNLALNLNFKPCFTGMFMKILNIIKKSVLKVKFLSKNKIFLNLFFVKINIIIALKMEYISFKQLGIQK